MFCCVFVLYLVLPLILRYVSSRIYEYPNGPYTEWRCVFSCYFGRSDGCLVARFDELVERSFRSFCMCWLICFVSVGSVRRFGRFRVLGLVDWSDFCFVSVARVVVWSV